MEYYEGLLKKYLTRLLVDFEDGSLWVVNKIIVEHQVESYGLPEAVAVASCIKYSKPEKGKEGILKVRMRLPWTEKPQFCDTGAPEEMSYLARQEILSLDALTKAGCSSTPKYLQSIRTLQTNDMCLPGGSLVFILMEKLPGVALEYFTYWQYEPETRNRIRGAFKEAWIEMRKCGFTNYDYGLHNLLWDEKNSKCYIVDLEECGTFRESEATPVWKDCYWGIWGLERSGNSSTR
ncbi:hypothetical protein FQN50_002325 [Emmonsiellopsis sp. PD_5]|nr:hypothetical protein FQN50_002325 [Emmonsiellopsis sp. PD_5]